MRCEHPDCRRRLALSDESVPCKCGRKFCGRHRFYDKHDCGFDYRVAPTTSGPQKLRSNEHQDYSNTAF